MADAVKTPGWSVFKARGTQVLTETSEWFIPTNWPHRALFDLVVCFVQLPRFDLQMPVDLGGGDYPASSVDKVNSAYRTLHRFGLALQ
ncbi:hypothetical protein EN935_33765, partial [Mesorhizobium sp. M7D.F.Ca.US.004.03.1.1]|uniref:hypothetical protein n=1 Tax=Mesorhizobium sp. M7D.F.Ca.US.004.03.1.1 TaxID=2496702 RepID=UPI000FD53283